MATHALCGRYVERQRREAEGEVADRVRDRKDPWLVGWEQIARECGRPAETVRRWGIPVLKLSVGSRPQIRRSELRRWLEERQENWLTSPSSHRR